jgi:hypothetical protein
MAPSTNPSGSPEGDDDPKSAAVALALGGMVVVGPAFGAQEVGVNILGSGRRRCALRFRGRRGHPCRLVGRRHLHV